MYGALELPLPVRLESRVPTSWTAHGRRQRWYCYGGSRCSMGCETPGSTHDCNQCECNKPARYRDPCCTDTFHRSRYSRLGENIVGTKHTRLSFTPGFILNTDQ